MASTQKRRWSTARRPPGRRQRRVENAEVSRILREMADVLELQGANTFRVRAYRNAARTVEDSTVSIAELALRDRSALTELPGIGEDLAGKIAEIARTGSLGALRTAARRAPRGAVDLMRIPSIGPKRARQLCDALGVHTLAGLARAARAGRIRELPGFGAKTEERLLRELAAHAEDEHRMLRSTAAQYGEPIVERLRTLPFVDEAELVGSFRRGKDTVGDLDLLVSSEDGARVTEAFIRDDAVTQVLAKGTTKASVRVHGGVQVDLRVVGKESFGAALVYFTGSKAHNIALRKLAIDHGLKINEYGVFRGARRVAGRTETEVYKKVGLAWIDPALREQRGEIEAAQQGKFPTLLTLDDIRGDLQVHTTDSDGRDSLEAMAKAAEALGYEYLAITDHTTRVRIAGGLDRAGFRRQIRRIDALNTRLRKLTLLKGAEVDINPDGTLDLDDATLHELDLVVVSLHSSLTLSPAEQTRRVIKALQHPSVDIFGHPTGRLLLRRRGATFDFDEVCRVAVNEGVMFEVNAQPERLDLDDVACRRAIEHGVRLVVSTDAHSAAGLQLMRWGVDQARRGWVEKRHVANTLSLARLRALLHGKR